MASNSLVLKKQHEHDTRKLISLAIPKETHRIVKEISIKANMQMGVLAEMMLRYAAENMVIVDEDDEEGK